MPFDIIVGRNESDLKKFGDRGTIFLGKQYIQIGQTTSLSNRILMDVARPHVILVSGKRGSGKSYSLSVIAEEMTNLPEEIANNLAIIMFDTMGIFWTMKFPNKREEGLLKSWNLKSKSIDVDIYTPEGFYEFYKENKIPTDFAFSIKPNELTASDWCDTFSINLLTPLGAYIERLIAKLKEQNINYSLDDILSIIKNDKKVNKEVLNTIENRFLAAKTWGLFSQEGFSIRNLVKRGKVSIIDISVYTNISGNWAIKNLVIGLISKKLLEERIAIRKLEEMESIAKARSILESETKKQEVPLLWLFLDEAHEAIPKEGKTPATNALVQILREGRQPGISMVLATQQPGEIHKDVISQSDLVIGHNITAQKDIEALNAMMQSYLYKDILTYINQLPNLKGSAIILDDNSERIYPMRVRPKFTWHGGESPIAIAKIKEEYIKKLLS